MLKGLGLPVRAGEFSVNVVILSIILREVPIYYIYY
jgi:hypothetical protein